MMNEDLTTQTSPAPIVLKLKKFDDHHVLPHPSHLTIETLDETNPSPNNSNLRVKLKKPLRNGNHDQSDDEMNNSTSTETNSRPAKRCKKSSSNDSNSQTIMLNDYQSSQEEKDQTMHEIKVDHGMISEASSNSPLVLKIRRDSHPSSLQSNSPTSGVQQNTSNNNVENDSNRQLLLKLKKNEYGTIVNESNMSIDYQANSMENLPTNGHQETLYKSSNMNVASNAPPITNMLANLTDSTTTTTTMTTIHVENSSGIKDQNQNEEKIISSQTSTPSTSDLTAETHTKELLDEALDSVKNVLMQTFKKNLESGGDLNALKSTLGSDEVAEVFLAKLRQSLKRETNNLLAEHEPKSHETSMETDVHQRCETPPISSTSSTTMISPVMNVVSSPSSSSPIVPSILTKTTTSPSMIFPTSPQSQNNSNSNSNKRKCSTPSTNPNRFDGATEEELAKRLLSDILQPNLDIVFVGINPSLYAVHKGHHYGGPGNHFWKLLHMSGLIPTPFTANDDYRVPQYGIGFTNIVQRPTKAGSDITKDEIGAGAEVLAQKIKMFRPKIVAFNGRGIYEVYAGNKHFHYGKQPELFPGTDTHVFVMPSSSARCSQLPRAEDKLPFYVGLRKLRDFVNGTLHSLNEAEITFPDIKIKDTDDVLQKTVIRISNKPFSELSAETLKPFGDKVPSAQLISKHPPSSSQSTLCSSPSPSSSSSSNLVFNTEALTTQTMSILHSTNAIEQNHNNNLLTQHDQQPQRVYLQNNGNYTPSPPPSTPPTPSMTVQLQRLSTNGIITTTKTNSLLENTSSNTNAAVLAALASGGYNTAISSPSSTNNSLSSSPSTFYQPTQTVFIGSAGQSHSFSSSTILNARSSPIQSVTTSTLSGGVISSQPISTVIHHPANSSSLSLTDTLSHSVTSSSPSTMSRQLVIVNSSETLPSFETILNSSLSIRSPSISTKDQSSSQPSNTKPTLILVPPTIKANQTNASSNIILPKITTTNQNKISTEKRMQTTTATAAAVNAVASAGTTTTSTLNMEDSLYIRYDREPVPSTNTSDPYRFSFVIDEYSPGLQKRLRYVSINDL